MNDRKLIPAAVIAEQLAGRAEQLCQRLLPNGHKEKHEWICGSVQGEKGQSLGVHLDGDKAGVWHDFTTGEGGDLIGLIKAVTGLDARDAIRWAKDWLGISDSNSASAGNGQLPKPAPRSDKQDVGATKRTEAALSIWRAARPAAGTAVEAYLASRGIAGPPPPSLRYHPNLRHGPTGLYFETMVAGVQGVGGRITGIHRTFLLPGGRGKAQVSDPKMALGTIGDGAVRLGPAAEILGMAEGIETGLSVMEMFKIPVWVTLGAGRLHRVALPDIVRHVAVFADNGGPGIGAANRAVSAYTAQRRKVTLRWPPREFHDYNEALKAVAKEAVA